MMAKRQQKKKGCFSQLFTFIFVFVALVVIMTGNDKDDSKTTSAPDPTATVSVTATPEAKPTNAPTTTLAQALSDDPIMAVLQKAKNDRFAVVSYEKETDMLIVELEASGDGLSYDVGSAVLYMMKTADEAFEASGVPEMVVRFFENNNGNRNATITMRLEEETASQIDFEDFYVKYGWVDEEAIQKFLSLMDGYSLIGEYKTLLQ